MQLTAAAGYGARSSTNVIYLAQQLNTRHLLITGLSRKRKQQLAHITARAAESHKSRKIDRGNQRRKRFLRKQKEEEDFWDEHEDPQSESNSDESNFDESSLVERSSDKENVDADDGRGDNTKEGLGDDDGGIQLEVEDNNFRRVWKDDADGYLQGVRELEKSVSTIVDMFSTHLNKNRPSDQDLLLSPPPTDIPSKISKKKGRETRFESQT